MRGWSAACIILGLLAGCVGSPESVETASSAEEVPVGSDAAAAGGASSIESANATAVAPPQPVAIPIFFEGSLPTFLEACYSAPQIGGQCHTAPADPEFVNRYLIEQDGNVSAFLLTVTWTPSSPFTEEMSVSFHSFNEDFSEFTNHARASGTSPLVLQMEAPFALEPGLTHRIGVGAGGTEGPDAPARVWGAAAVEQTFVVEGALTLVPLASPPP